MTIRRILAASSSFAILLLLTTLPLGAVVRDDGAGGDPRVLVPPHVLPVQEAVEPGAPGESGRAAAEFTGLRGGTWTFRFDRDTGLAALIQGSGIPVVPGRGNALGEEALAGLPLSDGEIDATALEPVVRAVLESHRSLLLPAAGTIELVPDESASRRDGRLHSLYFRWIVDGVPVERARVFVRVSAGNIVQLGAPLVGGRIDATRPSVASEAAVDAVLAWSGDGELARLVDEPVLLLQPERDGQRGLSYRLVWVVTYRLPKRPGTWEGRVDAVTGEVVAFRDTDVHARAKGAVYPRTVVDVETEAAMPHVDVGTEGGTVTGDDAGFFVYSGGRLSSGLDGPFFRTNCADGCSNPAQATFETSVGAGLVDFGFGGDQQIGNGISTRAERNAFYHLSRVRRVGRSWLPSEPWFDQPMTVNVNVASTCNASYSSGTNSTNFYRAGGGCNNTGEVADVMYHEWGHGVDLNTRGADGATGEGTADVVSVQMTHSPLIGPYFRTDGGPVRNVDRLTSANGLMTRTNVGQFCASGPGAQGYAVHCEGQIWGQTAWDLAQSLTARYGTWTGWRVSERLFFTSLPDAGGYLPTDAFPIYDAYVAADDDDGNLANGTPNGQEIFDAFDLHEIAGAPVGASPACTPPAEPSVGVQADCAQVEVSWSAVAEAATYRVLRQDVRREAAFYPVAEVAAGTTTWTDTAVVPGVDYWYVVEAEAADGCVSTVESAVSTRLDDQPFLEVATVAVDDTPRGNRSGFADPDEEVDVRVTLGNRGTADALGISGSLVAETPGVTILEGFDTWPDLAPDASAENEVALRFLADGGQVACGETLRFRLTPDESTACSTDDSWFEVTLGERTVEYADDFEIDDGWTLDVGASTATAGNWTYGDPDGTAYQPEDDATPDPGTNCWFTAPNAGGEGTDDVDGGVTVLVSPAIDLSGRTEAILSYQRWFANRDLGEDAGDFFRADVSDDDGATWVNLETLDTNQSAAAWTRVEFDLTQFIALTSQVRIRFQAADGNATGNLIEAAVDEVRIERAVCDDTPACFVEPDFAGVESAVPGASCAETTVTWQPATSNCQNATITYNVYRSTDPGFTPSDANRVAAGLAGTSFEDALLEPGVTYHYIVRAFDSRSGEDGNVAAASVVAPTSPDLAPPVFAGLESLAGGAACGETVLSWSAAAETCNAPVSYEIYRSTDPGFVPDAASRIGSSLSTSFVDAALAPGVAYTYVVRARDAAGNEDGNAVRFTAEAKILDATLEEVLFETGAAGWTVVAPNDAVTGNWELGDPEGTEFQPEDDHTPEGVNAWVTGLAAAGGGGGNDIDTGTTTLLSGPFDLSGAVDPVVAYWRWFTNDLGGAPGEDPLVVEISNDDGATWAPFEEVGAGTPLAWVKFERRVAEVLPPTSQMRLRFTASDLAGGSLVECAIDDFALIDRDQGCNGCASPAPTVGEILVSRDGDDVVLDWTADPIVATRFVVYKLGGAGFADAVRIGSTETRTFRHAGAALASGEDFYYRVTAVDACGQESGLP